MPNESTAALIDFITIALADYGQERALLAIADAAYAERSPPELFVPQRIDDCWCCGLIRQVNGSGWCLHCRRSVEYKPTLDAKTAKTLEDACVKAADGIRKKESVND